MVVFNYASREITAKIVYYGPGLCGKTTNLEHIHKKVDPRGRGQMLSLATETDRTLFFDLLPVDLGKVNGFSVRIQLFTVPGQTYYNATRQIVLRGADGVVFVADSQRSQLDSNIESWGTLEDNLATNGLDIEAMPLVIQFNKQDLPPLASHQELNRAINFLNAPTVKAVASKGDGVIETFKLISKKVLESLRGRTGKVEPAANQEAPRPAQGGPSMMKVTTEKTHISSPGVSKERIKRESSLARHGVESNTKAVESWSNLESKGKLAGVNGAETVELIGAIRKNLSGILEANKSMSLQFEDMVRLMDKLADRLKTDGEQ